MTPAALLSGRILRAFREHRHVSAGELAERAHVAASTVSMWESGRRTAHASVVAKVAQALGLPPAENAALNGLLRAATTPLAVAPQITWAHNFQPPSQPAWLWIRPDPSSGLQRVTLSWGPFVATITEPLPTAGLLIHAPASAPNPPVVVTLDAAGWVDFGVGVVPPAVAEQLGIDMRDARTLLKAFEPLTPGLGPHEPVAGPLAPWFEQGRDLARRLGLAWELIAPHFGVLRPGWSEVGPGIPGEADRPLSTVLLLPPPELQRCRESRGLSRRELADRVNALDGFNQLTAKAIEKLELTGRPPDIAGVTARLDRVLELDGRLGLDRTYYSHNPATTTHRIRFPDYWIGPVWIQVFTDRIEAVGVDLIWGPWKRRQRLHHGAVVTTRKSEAGAGSLQVITPRGCRVVAGTGLPPMARDINGGWRPLNTAAAVRLVRDGIMAVLRPAGPRMAANVRRERRPAPGGGGSIG